MPLPPSPGAGSDCSVDWLHTVMPEPYSATLASLNSGRAATVARLRVLTERLEQLPLDDAVEVIVLLEPALAAFDRQANLALECAPSSTR